MFRLVEIVRTKFNMNRRDFLTVGAMSPLAVTGLAKLAQADTPDKQKTHISNIAQEDVSIDLPKLLWFTMLSPVIVRSHLPVYKDNELNKEATDHYLCLATYLKRWRCLPCIMWYRPSTVRFVYDEPNEVRLIEATLALYAYGSDWGLLEKWEQQFTEKDKNIMSASFSIDFSCMKRVQSITLPDLGFLACQCAGVRPQCYSDWFLHTETYKKELLMWEQSAQLRNGKTIHLNPFHTS
jgi:hypothetical protein